MLEDAEFGGGYGSTGCTIEADGDIYTDGALTVDGNANLGGTLYLDSWNIVISNAGKGLYFGDASTDGTWVIERSGDDLVFKQRESGSYVLKHTFSGA